MKNIIMACATAFLMSACASVPRQQVPAKDNSKNVQVSSQAKTVTTQTRAMYFTKEEVDVIRDSIDLPVSFDEIGFYEKRFNPCTHGIRDRGCETQLFMTLNFQLVCRDTEGTVEHSDHILRPFANRSLNLKLGPHRRETQTDPDGFAQLQLIHATSLRAAMLVLESRPFSLGVRAQEVRKIVLPNDWCAN